MEETRDAVAAQVGKLREAAAERVGELEDASRADRHRQATACSQASRLRSERARDTLEMRPAARQPILFRGRAQFAETIVRDNAAWVGGIGLAIGALIASSLPSTRARARPRSEMPAKRCATRSPMPRPRLSTR